MIGASATMFTQEYDDSMSDRGKDIDDKQVNWTFTAGSHARIYVSVFEKNPAQSFLSEVDLVSGTLQALDVSGLHGIAIDPVRQRAYAPRRADRLLEIADFPTGARTQIALSKSFWSADLAPARGRLAVSDHSRAEDPSIAIIDVATNAETALPVSGAHASWLNDDVLLFVRGESELLRHNLRTQTTESLFSVHDGLPPGHGSYAQAPHVSKSGRLVVWGFVSGTPPELVLRTIVVDVERGEYRLIEGWWHNVALLEG